MVELSFNVKQQDIRVFEDVIPEEKARQLAEQSKHKSFGLISSIMRRIDKSGEDIALTHMEKRYDPVWYIKGELYLEYKRMTEYTFPVKQEVTAVRIQDKVNKAAVGHVSFLGEDHCLETAEKEMLVDAVTGKSLGLQSWLSGKARSIRQTEDLMGEGKVVVPVKVKASFFVRDMIKDLIKPFHADKVIKESAAVKQLTLYFKPSYAFEYKEKSTNKVRVFEVDGLTGEVRAGSVFKRELAEVFSEGEIFRIGKDVALALVPGGEAAGVLVSKLVEKHKTRKAADIKEKMRRAER